MKGDLLTADGLQAASIVALASILDVHRNRVAEWRAKGAPDSLDLHAWSGWLQRSGRAVLSSRVRAAILKPDEAGQQLEAPAAQDESSALGDDDAQLAGWRLRESKAKALRAELALEQERAEAAVTRRDLIATDEVRGLLSRFAAAVNDVVGRGIWSDLLQAMPGASVDLINRLRKAHTDAVLVQRGRIATAAQDVASSIRQSTKETT